MAERFEQPLERERIEGRLARLLDRLAERFPGERFFDASDDLLPEIGRPEARRKQVTVDVDKGIALSIIAEPIVAGALVADIAQKRRLADMRLADDRGAFAVVDPPKDRALAILTPDEPIRRHRLTVAEWVEWLPGGAHGLPAYFVPNASSC